MLEPCKWPFRHFDGVYRKDLIPFENTSIVFVDEVFAIEKPGTQLNVNRLASPASTAAADVPLSESSWFAPFICFVIHYVCLFVCVLSFWIFDLASLKFADMLYNCISLITSIIICATSVRLCICLWEVLVMVVDANYATCCTKSPQKPSSKVWVLLFNSFQSWLTDMTPITVYIVVVVVRIGAR